MSEWSRTIQWDRYYDPPQYDEPDYCLFKGCTADLYDEDGDELEGVDWNLNLCPDHAHALQKFGWLALCSTCGSLHRRPYRFHGERMVAGDCYKCAVGIADMEHDMNDAFLTGVD